MKRSVFAFAIAGPLLLVQGAPAYGGADFGFDFVASEASSYNHATGGGSFNDRTINEDVVESLEGDDFECGDIVTFLTQITVDDGVVGDQTVVLTYGFTAHATGQQGIALIDDSGAPPPDGLSAAINGSGIDSGTVDNANSVATVLSEVLLGTVFVKPATFVRVIQVTGLEANETVVLRQDVQIVCNGNPPTGNMQAKLLAATNNGNAIPGGTQTVPFKHVEGVKKPPPPPK